MADDQKWSRHSCTRLMAYSLSMELLIQEMALHVEIRFLHRLTIFKSRKRKKWKGSYKDDQELPDEDSDSEDETSDEEKTKAKKEKKEKSEEKAKMKPNSDELLVIPLSQKKYCKVKKFAGKIWVDFREHYEKDGKILPGQKGLMLSKDEWTKVKAAFEEIDKALTSN